MESLPASQDALRLELRLAAGAGNDADADDGLPLLCLFPLLSHAGSSVSTKGGGRSLSSLDRLLRFSFFPSHWQPLSFFFAFSTVLVAFRETRPSHEPRLVDFMLTTVR